MFSTSLIDFLKIHFKNSKLLYSKIWIENWNLPFEICFRQSAWIWLQSLTVCEWLISIAWRIDESSSSIRLKYFTNVGTVLVTRFRKFSKPKSWSRFWCWIAKILGFRYFFFVIFISLNKHSIEIPKFINFAQESGRLLILFFQFFLLLFWSKNTVDVIHMVGKSLYTKVKRGQV